MATELAERGLRFEQQCALPLAYKGSMIDCAYRIDLLVERQVIVELKSAVALGPIHVAQLSSYLKLSGQVGLLINFNVPLLKDGIRRIVLGLPEVSSASSASSAVNTSQ
jgi:GxxExxY protein